MGVDFIGTLFLWRDNMILLIYMGVLFFCYGIYNLFCYFRMFPTAKAGRHLLKLYRKIVRLCDNIFMVQLAEKLVRKLDFEQKELSMISAVLSYNGVNYSAAIYLFSRLLMAACGIILSLPLVFIGVRWMLAMCVGIILFTAADYGFMLLQYWRYIDELKKDLPVLGLLAEKYFERQEDTSHFIELSRRISGDAWYGIWSDMLCQKKQLSEEVQYQSKGWTDIWLLRFIEGMVSEKKTEYYKDLYRDLCSDRSKKREKRLQQHCKWLRLLPGVFFFCQILLLFSLLT